MKPFIIEALQTKFPTIDPLTLVAISQYAITVYLEANGSFYCDNCLKICNMDSIHNCLCESETRAWCLECINIHQHCLQCGENLLNLLAIEKEEEVPYCDEESEGSEDAGNSEF